MSRRDATRLAVAAAAVVGLLGGFLAMRAARSSSRTEALATAARIDAEAPAPPPAAPSLAPPEGSAASALGVVAVEGKAERGHGRARHALAVGDVVEGNDWIATGRTSSVSLGGAGGATIRIASSTRVRVDESRRGRAGLTLERGRVRAVAGPETAVSIRAGDGRATVEASDADVSVQAEPGVLRVVPHRNRVVLMARDERVEVAEGSGAEVKGDRPPTLAPVPRSLLLKVRWPEPTAQRAAVLHVDGETAPGATVRSGHAEVVADARGRFSIAVPLHEGENQPRLSVEDLAGRQVTSTGNPVVVDRRRPQIVDEGVRYQ